MTVVLDAVAQSHGTSTVIDSLSVALRPGTTALPGPNGADKTTLLRTLATVLPPRNGRSRIDEVEVSGERSAGRSATGSAICRRTSAPIRR